MRFFAPPRRTWLTGIPELPMGIPRTGEFVFFFSAADDCAISTRWGAQVEVGGAGREPGGCGVADRTDTLSQFSDSRSGEAMSKGGGGERCTSHRSVKSQNRFRTKLDQSGFPTKLDQSERTPGLTFPRV